MRSVGLFSSGGLPHRRSIYGSAVVGPFCQIILRKGLEVLRGYDHRCLAMITIKSLTTVVAIANFALAGFAVAGPKTYQVTGPILEVTDASIVVQKGTERWEVSRDAKMTLKGELKVGAKVTVEYTMNAVTAEVKGGDKPAAKDAPKTDKAAPAKDAPKADKAAPAKDAPKKKAA